MVIVVNKKIINAQINVMSVKASAKKILTILENIILILIEIRSLAYLFRKMKIKEK